MVTRARQCWPGTGHPPGGRQKCQESKQKAQSWHPRPTCGPRRAGRGILTQTWAPPHLPPSRTAQVGQRTMLSNEDPAPRPEHWELETKGRPFKIHQSKEKRAWFGRAQPRARSIPALSLSQWMNEGAPGTASAMTFKERRLSVAELGFLALSLRPRGQRPLRGETRGHRARRPPSPLLQLKQAL